MSYFPKGHHAAADEVDDFDEYDPTPYGGGYDISLTYGRPLPPSEETCYPNTSSASGDFDYDRPQYDTGSRPSAYAGEALDDEYNSYGRPKPRPNPPSYGGSEYGQPEPDYGQPEPDYGSGYGRRPQYGDPSSEYGSEFGSGYGRKPEYEQPVSEYGRYERPPGSEYGSGYGRNPETEGFGYAEQVPSYGRPSYQTEEYDRPSYGRSEEEDYRKPRYERRDDDDDEEEENNEENRGHRHHRHHHHHGKHYDD